MRFGIQLLLFIAVILRASAPAHAQAVASPHPPYPQIDDPVKIAAGEARQRAWDQIAKQGMEALKKGDKPKAIKLLEQYMTENMDFNVRMTLVGIYTEAGGLRTKYASSGPLSMPTNAVTPTIIWRPRGCFTCWTRALTTDAWSP